MKIYGSSYRNKLPDLLGKRKMPAKVPALWLSRQV
jgi:hypothetical protein